MVPCWTRPFPLTDWFGVSQDALHYVDDVDLSTVHAVHFPVHGMATEQANRRNLRSKSEPPSVRPPAHIPVDMAFHIRHDHQTRRIRGRRNDKLL